MKKKLLALILAATMAFPVAAFADDAEEETAAETVAETAAEEETEAASTILVMQGSDENNIVWTIAINTENAKGCVSLTPAEGETTYVTGPITFDEGSFTIADEEDGQDYVFGYEDISETETILTYEPTGSEVKLTYVDQTALADADVDNYMIYAGTDKEGNQLTFVFDTENKALAISQKKPDGTSETLAGTFEETEGEDSTTLHFTSEAGAESDIVLAPVDGTVKELDITVEGETLRVSMVDTAVLQAE